MKSDWHWKCIGKMNDKILKKEGKYYELWRIWWTIRATRIEGKIK